MSDELARLRADLEAMKRIEGLWAFGHAFSNEFYEQQGKIRDKIARLEAEAADPWREHRASVEFMRKTVYAAADVPKVVAYVDHLTADRDRLAARVAELEAAAEPPFGPSDDQMEREIMSSAVELVEGLGGKPDPDGPILDPKRIAATMARIAKGWRPDDHRLIEELEFLAAINEGDSAKPYRLKGASK